MNTYDVIVVGARAAGSPTAMLLARKGYRVLVVDRATFPSDTLSTHLVHHPGMAALDRWSLAERLIATGCPPIDTYRFDFGPFALAATPRPAGTATRAYAPRRTVLDKLLVDAAREAGAEVREGFSVTDLIVENGIVRGVHGRSRHDASMAEYASVVVGADGVHSLVAKRVGATKYNEIPPQEAMYYSYWSGVPTHSEFQAYLRPERCMVAIPTHDDLTCVVVAWSIDEFDANKCDIEGNYLRAFAVEPTFSERIVRGRRESRILGTAQYNFYRQAYGPGWALVGDAGYHKDACTAQGISDAFQQAELLSDALDTAFTGALSYDEALGRFQRTRDETTRPMYDLTVQFASFAPPPAEMEQLLGAISGNPRAIEDFVSMQAGTMPVQDFFEPANIAGYLQASGMVPA
jgi:flavin-dependent dehydrogenase